MCHSFLPTFIQELIFTFIQDWYTICFNTDISVILIDLCTDILQHIPKIVSTDRYMLYSPQMPHLVFNGVPYRRGVIWPFIFVTIERTFNFSSLFVMSFLLFLLFSMYFFLWNISPEIQFFSLFKNWRCTITRYHNEIKDTYYW